MVALIYSLVSTVLFGMFVITSIPLIKAVFISQQVRAELFTQVQQKLDQEKRNQQRLLAQQQKTLKPVGIADTITAEAILPIPIPIPVDKPNENYVVEPIGDGFYKMDNVPDEPMSTVADLNQAVNHFRGSQGKGSLEQDGHLCEFADKRAHEIADNFSHDPFSKHIDEGIANDWGFSNFGENIWQGKFMGVHIVEYGWAKSPGHYGALVGDWTKGCAGIYNDNAVYIFAR